MTDLTSLRSLATCVRILLKNILSMWLTKNDQFVVGWPWLAARRPRSHSLTPSHQGGGTT